MAALTAAVQASRHLGVAKGYLHDLFSRGNYFPDAGLSQIRYAIDVVAEELGGAQANKTYPVSIRKRAAKFITAQFEASIGWTAWSNQRDERLNNTLREQQDNLRIRNALLGVRDR